MTYCLWVLYTLGVVSKNPYKTQITRSLPEFNVHLAKLIEAIPLDVRMAVAFINGHYTSPPVFDMIATIAAFLEVQPTVSTFYREWENLPSGRILVDGHATVTSYLNAPFYENSHSIIRRIYALYSKLQSIDQFYCARTNT